MPQNMLPTDLVFQAYTIAKNTRHLFQNICLVFFTKCLLFFSPSDMAFFTMGIFLFPTQFSYFFFALNFKLFSIANENSHVQIECMVVSKGFMALQIFVQ